VGLHDGEFLGAQLARLEQDAVRNADLADVVQRRRLEQQVQGFVIEKAGKARMRLQTAGQAQRSSSA